MEPPPPNDPQQSQEISFHVNPRRSTRHMQSRRSSLFEEEIIVPSPTIQINEQTGIAEPGKNEYIEKLTNEKNAWIDLVEDKRLELKGIQNRPAKVIEPQTLNAEQRMYLEAAPNFQEYLDEIQAFRKKSEYFLRVHNDYLERRTDFKHLIETNIDAVTRNIIARKHLE